MREIKLNNFTHKGKSTLQFSTFFLNFSPHKNNFPPSKRHKIDYLADKQFVFKKKPLKIYSVSEITCNKTFPKGFSTTDTLLHN